MCFSFDIGNLGFVLTMYLHHQKAPELCSCFEKQLLLLFCLHFCFIFVDTFVLLLFSRYQGHLSLGNIMVNPADAVTVGKNKKTLSKN